MTRCQKAIELGRKVGIANRKNPGGIKTLRLLVKQWKKASVRNCEEGLHISHSSCVACVRHWNPPTTRESECSNCPFAVFAGNLGCVDLVKGEIGGSVYMNRASFEVPDVSVRTLRRLKWDIVEFLKSAVKAAKEKESQNDQT